MNWKFQSMAMIRFCSLKNYLSSKVWAFYEETELYGPYSMVGPSPSNILKESEQFFIAKGFYPLIFDLYGRRIVPCLRVFSQNLVQNVMIQENSRSCRKPSIQQFWIKTLFCQYYLIFNLQLIIQYAANISFLPLILWWFFSPLKGSM